MFDSHSPGHLTSAREKTSAPLTGGELQTKQRNIVSKRPVLMINLAMRKVSFVSVAAETGHARGQRRHTGDRATCHRSPGVHASSTERDDIIAKLKSSGDYLVGERAPSRTSLPRPRCNGN
mmetsp:Transcript_18497/g.45528  ORF Transcript_18497/g.45528 Transcript_18497/m.45528 type:complete len:121 (+) Transcript_18497:155-517(+)